ncbi:single-stranded-DNA-specific exonuclease RecJ [Candidatus Parcubacteria bacterium]|nr:single-stranded-DNA-specific exonuclease RecJ [Candidatus Parcubacteria bacterium]
MKFQSLLENLLNERGISPENREEFLNPDWRKLHDPLHLPDMVKARDRVVDAMKKGEHIFVFSDYDADGIPGAVVLSDFFKRAKYDNVSFYIPHRHDEGFGLSNDAIDEAERRGAQVLITIDCGTTDVEEVKYAKDKGIDVIITDHHEQGAKLPPALALVNPKLKKSKYPFKNLCGSGVAFKLVQAILDKERFGIKEGQEKWSLDMVGIATLSDMVPLVGENRILAAFGLQVLRKSPRPGLQALLRNLRMDQRNLTEDDIAFMITPRINAASRMGVPMDAFKLLSSTDPREAQVLALHLEKINNERKGVVASLVKDAKKHLSGRELKSVIVIGNPEWRPALLGLVANTLSEDYKRPAFVWGRDGDGVLKGSCRSYNGFDTHRLMTEAEELFIEFGGHKEAGGFAVTLENLQFLEGRLSEILDTFDTRTEEEETSVELNPEDVCEDLWKTISVLAPFGTGNPKPIFKIPAEILSVRQFGKEGNHLEVKLFTPAREVKAIAFFATPESFSTLVKTGSKTTLLGHMEKSYFMNRPELRVRIIDIV